MASLHAVCAVVISNAADPKQKLSRCIEIQEVVVFKSREFERFWSKAMLTGVTPS